MDAVWHRPCLKSFAGDVECLHRLQHELGACSCTSVLYPWRADPTSPYLYNLCAGTGNRNIFARNTSSSSRRCAAPRCVAFALVDTAVHMATDFLPDLRSHSSVRRSYFG